VALCGAAKRAVIIVNALDDRPKARTDWLKNETEGLTGLGLSASELDLRHYFGAPAKLADVLNAVDFVWASGGNTFMLRRAMKQSGFDVLAKDAVARDRIVYGGFSAGAVVATPDLHGLEHIDPPNAVPAGYDPQIVWDGLGLVPFALVVHFESFHPESELIDRQIAYFKRERIAYRTLRDGEALVIEEGRERLVS